MGKGEIAHHKQFLLFPQCFQTTCFPGASFSKQEENTVGKGEMCNFSFSHSVFKSLVSQGRQKVSMCGKGLTLIKRQFFRLLRIESICRWQNKCNLKVELLFGIGRKHYGRRRKCWLPAFPPFPTVFSKGFFLWVVESVVKSWTNPSINHYFVLCFCHFILSCTLILIVLL